MKEQLGAGGMRSLRRTLLLSLLIPSLALCQQRISTSLVKSDRISGDSSISSHAADSLGLRQGKVKVVDEERSKSTGLAMLLSTVLPGAGQVYVERYWTIPVIWGFGYYFGNLYLKAGNLYKDYQDQFAQSVDADTLSHLGNSHLRDIRDFYRDERDRFAIYLALTYVLNIVDAYVGASLYSFDVSDNLGGSAAVRFKIPIR